MSGNSYALILALSYLAFGALWLLSSTVMTSSSFYPYITNGWLYVSLTAVLIYIISQRYIGKLTQAHKQLQSSYDEITTVHEELTATEEELRQQFDEILSANEKISTQNTLLVTLQETTTNLINQLDLEKLITRIN